MNALAVYINARELLVMRRLLVGMLFAACLTQSAMLLAAPLSVAGLRAQQLVIAELAKLEKSKGKYIRSSKLQALVIMTDAIKANPELAASLTAYVIEQGAGLTATVTAACKAAPEFAAAITTAAINAAPAAQAALITSAAVSAVPKRAAEITTAAIAAVVKQAPAITSAAVSAAPNQAAEVTKAALKAAGSTEVRRLVAVAASNAGVSVTVINNILKKVTTAKDGSFEVFQKDAGNTTTSTISIGQSSSNDSVPSSTVSSNTTGTSSVGGGGTICRKASQTASCS